MSTEDISMGGRYEGYDVALLGRVGDKEVYALSPTTGGDAGVWITIEREAGDVELSEIVKGSEMVSAHTAWLRYLMERSTSERIERGFGFGLAGDGDGDGGGDLGV